MEKLMMNKLEDMELDNVAGGKWNSLNSLDFLKRISPLKSPRLAQTDLSKYREKAS
ncbi:hypothetical protein [Selenomonas ruminantium]|uniref:Uncharacterized protein n=1 Tax=Selenomonas ruminantium TaxID=971 RepID=A0A1K1MKH8_SELRU|nr:hypothetical protein [Selenomonas ruminantium]SFW23585.1 hypothetical protein SAMN02910323_0913 [Selenomonas ruminantium]